ncbi:MAG: A/G-specific adenine glycosylase [Kiritimatiellia bacterium]
MTLAHRLCAWFRRVKRPMPWRLEPTPYFCWLSEIMMQQTTYTAVLPYYARFLERFPTVEALAAAEESAVLKAWEGLGYYARARNLHKAAKAICAAGAPRWPKGVEGWSAVPGVGPYTAAALASVLDGEKAPVVDGNVARVFARVWRLDDDFHKLPARRRLAERLRPLMDARGCRPGDFNQAMMELGALVCTPANPACETCPLAADCAARKAGAQADYPRKAVRGELPVRKSTAVVVTDGAGGVLLVENRRGGLLRGLWELPTVEPATEQVQVFSHFRLELTALRAKENAVFADPKSVPLSTSTRKVLVKCGLL